MSIITPSSHFLVKYLVRALLILQHLLHQVHLLILILPNVLIDPSKGHSLGGHRSTALLIDNFLYFGKFGHHCCGQSSSACGRLSVTSVEGFRERVVCTRAIECGLHHQTSGYGAVVVVYFYDQAALVIMDHLRLKIVAYGVAFIPFLVGGVLFYGGVLPSCLCLVGVVQCISNRYSLHSVGTDCLFVRGNVEFRVLRH